MEYKYTIESINEETNLINVRYESTGKKTINKLIQVTDEDLLAGEAALNTICEYWSSAIKDTWDRIDNKPTVPNKESIIGKENTATFVDLGTPQPPTIGLEEKAKEVKTDRNDIELSGFVWSAPNSTNYRVPSDRNQLARFASIGAAVASGSTPARDYMLELQELDEFGDFVGVVYKAMTIADLASLLQGLLAHVEKCAKAEQNATDKILLGQDTTFLTEFNLL